jgi:hypothetical protein
MLLCGCRKNEILQNETLSAGPLCVLCVLCAVCCVLCAVSKKKENDDPRPRNYDRRFRIGNMNIIWYRIPDLQSDSLLVTEYNPYGENNFTSIPPVHR